MRKRIVLLVLAAVSLLCGLTLSSYAEEKEFAYLESSRDIVINVTWETAQPKVLFLAPDGRVFDPLADTDGTVTVIGDKAMYYLIRSAPAGQWHVDLTKQDAGSVQISWSDYHPSVRIESYSVGQVQGSEIPVTFRATCEDGNSRYYQYRISAVVSKVGDEKILYEGSAYTGSDVSRNVSLRNLSSGSGFMLKLYVWYSEDRADFFDTAFSDPFTYTNPDTNDSYTDFACVILPEEDMFYVSFPNAGYSINDFLVAVFENDGAEPVFYNTYEKDMEAELSYSPDAGKVRVEVTPNYGGLNGKTISKTFSPADFRLSVACEESTVYSQLPVSYRDMPKDTLLNVSVNGSQDAGAIVEGSGTVLLTLADGSNHFTVEYTADGCVWRIDRTVYLNRSFPEIVLGENYDGMRTDREEIELVGSVKNAVSMTLNGEAVELDAAAFCCKVPLAPGENRFEFAAVDNAGAEAKATVVIIRGEAAERSVAGEKEDGKEDGFATRILDNGSLLWAGLGGLAALLVMLYALIFWKHPDKKKGKGSEKE